MIAFENPPAPASTSTREFHPQIHSGAGQIEMGSVSKRFGGRSVLRDVNLDVAPGEAVAIVGRSGCGKTTLLRILAGIEKSDTGGIWIDRVAVATPDPRVRVMFQESRLLPWKRVMGNVMTGLPACARADAETILGEVGLSGRETDWPKMLSGGQLQRVALARALSARPEVLLLDEPLSALDALTRLEMQNLIERLWLQFGFTLVLVTHDVEEAVALADRVYVMAEGSWTTAVEVNLPRPRDRSSSEFVEKRAAVLSAILSSGDSDRLDRNASPHERVS